MFTFLWKNYHGGKANYARISKQRGKKFGCHNVNNFLCKILLILFFYKQNLKS